MRLFSLSINIIALFYFSLIEERERERAIYRYFLLSPYNFTVVSFSFSYHPFTSSVSTPESSCCFCCSTQRNQPFPSSSHHHHHHLFLVTFIIYLLFSQVQLMVVTVNWFYHSPSLLCHPVYLESIVIVVIRLSNMITRLRPWW